MLAFLADDFMISAIPITLSIFIARRYWDKRSFVSLGVKLDDAASRDLLFGIFYARPTNGAGPLSCNGQLGLASI